MNRSFSLATLNLLIAIAAVCFASTRTALARAWKGDSAEIVVLVIAGALVGTTFGLVLAIWNRPGWIVSLAAIVGGLFLGAAAGRRCASRSNGRYCSSGPTCWSPPCWW